MRMITGFLLLLNLTFLAWQQGWLGAPDTAPSYLRFPFEQASQRLVLLGELPTEQLALMERLAGSQERMANAREQLTEVQAERVEVEQRLTGAQEEAVAVVQGAREEAKAVVPWCGSAGVFADEPAAAAYVAALSTLGAKGILESREEVVSSSWWVYMPSFPSEAVANRMVAELKGKNIDSYYMRTGELAGGISMGVFSRQARVLVAQEEFGRRGYKTSIKEVDKLGRRFYVTIEMSDSALLDSPEWADFVASRADLQVSEKLCEVIAPKIQFP